LAFTVLFLAACITAQDSVAQAERGERNRPGSLGTRRSPRRGFIYALPIVMDYAVMYERVDRSS